MRSLTRRNFLKKGSAAAAGLSLLKQNTIQNSPDIRVAVIGTGRRGAELLKTLTQIDGVEISSLCDLNESRATSLSMAIRNAGRKLPSVYGGDERAYEKMLNVEKPDAVIIATPWDSHSSIAIKAMEKGCTTGVEVPAALSVKELWDIVNVSERTGSQCMILENNSFCRDNLALLNMKRQGLFGDIVHCNCAHSHDLADFWFFDAKNGDPNWAVKYLINYNRDQWPTQGLGPILGWMDINRGDIFTSIYSTSSSRDAINVFFSREFGKDFPAGKIKYKQGDVITSVLKTRLGKTLVITSDLQLPRPYDNRWMLQGNRGIYDEGHDSVFIEGKTKDYHKWEPFKPYISQFNHKWWDADYSSRHNEGTDYVMLRQFIAAVRSKTVLPLDVYDSATMSAVVELSGLSIERNAPVEFPDFTKGKWQSNKPYFGL